MYLDTYSLRHWISRAKPQATISTQIELRCQTPFAQNTNIYIHNCFLQTYLQSCI